MKAIAIILAVISLVTIPKAHADSLTESVQQKLKDQGFYYGEVTGEQDADTRAAIRRYQIRNGLQITGEMNAETQKSLGVKGNAPPARPTPARSVPDPRDDESREQTLRLPAPRSATSPGYAPGPHGLASEAIGLFEGTPYDVAPPGVQRRVIVGAQSSLARQGYYRNEINGVFGPGMEFALRAYQTRFGLEPSGRLDMETLAVLGLLPGQRAPGVTAARRRPPIYAPRGERVYIPR